MPNEVLGNLPDDMLAAIHDHFIVMYMTATTPADYKNSMSMLLHKKGNERRLESYRPICLANTIALWTALLAEYMAEYAEHYDLLNSSQEGFRASRNTIGQLKMMQNALADARMNKQDLYAMYIDFSSALNTVDHDKLLIIMHKLAFPEA